MSTFCADRWVCHSDMLLELTVGAVSHLWLLSQRHFSVHIKALWLLRRANRAPEPGTAVLAFAVTRQRMRLVKFAPAHLSRSFVNVITDERLVIQVCARNMTLQRLLLSKDLLTRGIAGTSQLFFLLVPLPVISHALTSRESLATSRPITQTISLVLVITLDMSLEMAVSKKGFVATCLAALEWSLICM